MAGLSVAIVVTAYGSGYDRDNLYARDLDFRQDDLYTRNAEPFAELYERDIDDEPYYAGYKRDAYNGEAMDIDPCGVEVELYPRALIDDYLSSLRRRDLMARVDRESSPEISLAALKRKKSSYNDARAKDEEKRRKKEAAAAAEASKPPTVGNPSEHLYAENKIAHKHFHPQT